MKHDPIQHLHNRLAQRRRAARNAALFCAGITALAAIGLRVSESFGNVGGAAVCGLVAALALMVGAVAASEA